MVGKITKDGALILNKNGTMIPQCCPHQAETACGDWCPFFEELRGQNLTICRDRTFAGIVDEREHRPDGYRAGQSDSTPAQNRAYRRRKKKELPQWIPEGDLLKCPKCGKLKRWAGTSRYRPRHCKGCGTKLAMMDE